MFLFLSFSLQCLRHLNDGWVVGVTSALRMGRLSRIIIHFSNSSNSNVRLTNGVFSAISTAINGSVYAFPSCPTSVHTPRNSLANISNFRIRVNTKHICAPNSGYSILMTVGTTTLGARCECTGSATYVVVSASDFRTGSLRGTTFTASGPVRRLNVGGSIVTTPVSRVMGSYLTSSNVSGGTVLGYHGVFTLNLIY